MPTTTNIRAFERKEVQESLLAFRFDASGVPEMLDESQSLKDSLALLNFAREAIERRSREIIDEIMKQRRSVA